MGGSLRHDGLTLGDDGDGTGALMSPAEDTPDRKTGEDIRTPVDRLSRTIAGRIARTIRMRGVRMGMRLDDAILAKSRQLAEVALEGTSGSDGTTPAEQGADTEDIAILAEACSAIVCDLPTANIMELLLPDPHLGPLEQALSTIAEVASRYEEGREAPLGTWRPVERVVVDLPRSGDSSAEDGTTCQQRIRQAVDRAIAHWDALSPHGRALARVDRTGIRKGLILALGFEEFLAAQERMGRILGPRQPYVPSAFEGT